MVIAKDMQALLSSSGSCGFAYVILRLRLGSFSQEPFYQAFFADGSGPSDSY